MALPSFIYFAHQVGFSPIFGNAPCRIGLAEEQALLSDGPVGKGAFQTCPLGLIGKALKRWNTIVQLPKKIPKPGVEVVITIFCDF
jgi:hypothetical protein